VYKIKTIIPAECVDYSVYESHVRDANSWHDWCKSTLWERVECEDTLADALFQNRYALALHGVKRYWNHDIDPTPIVSIDALNLRLYNGGRSWPIESVLGSIGFTVESNVRQANKYPASDMLDDTEIIALNGGLASQWATHVPGQWMQQFSYQFEMKLSVWTALRQNIERMLIMRELSA
jgi:hypothetical protein